MPDNYNFCDGLINKKCYLGLLFDDFEFYL